MRGHVSDLGRALRRLPGEETRDPGDSQGSHLCLHLGSWACLDSWLMSGPICLSPRKLPFRFTGGPVASSELGLDFLLL